MATDTMKKQTYKCKLCGEKFFDLDDLIDHLDEGHSDDIPKDFTPAQFYYALKTGTYHRECMICKNHTPWNPSTNKYNVFCGNPVCTEKYREIFKKRMIGAHGKVHLLNDPEKQKEMLANRKISGKYRWSDGKEKTYTGSYELDGLKVLDVFLDFDSDDIMSPSPHTYTYMYQGEEKFYIPDVFIASLGLEIEFKDGGDNPNMHHKIQAVDKVKEKLKDQVMTQQKSFSYIKIENKNYSTLFEFLSLRKQQYIDFDGDTREKDKIETPIFILKPSTEFSRPINLEVSRLMESFSSFRTALESSLEDARTPYVTTMFMVSEENLHEYTVHPHIPDTYMTQNDFENSTIKRVSLFETVDGAIMKLGNAAFGKTLTVYVPHESCTLQNSDVIIPSSDSVPGSGYTKEVWITKPVKVTAVARISVGDILDPPLIYKYQNHSGIHYKRSWSIDTLFNAAPLETLHSEQVYLAKKRTGVTNLTTSPVAVLEGVDYTKGVHPVYILLTYTDTSMAKIIRFVTRDPYSHASISFDSSMHDVYSFGRKDKDDVMKFINEDIDQGVLKDVKEHAQYALFVTFVNTQEFRAMQKALANFKRREGDLKFSYIGLVNVALGRETSRENEYFCSQFVAEILQAGMQLDRATSLYTPYDLAQIGGVQFVTRGALRNYNKASVDAKVKKMLDKIGKDIKDSKTKPVKSLKPASPIVLEGIFDESLDDDIKDIGEDILGLIVDKAKDKRRSFVDMSIRQIRGLPWNYRTGLTNVMIPITDEEASLGLISSSRVGKYLPAYLSIPGMRNHLQTSSKVEYTHYAAVDIYDVIPVSSGKYGQFNPTYTYIAVGIPMRIKLPHVYRM